MMLNYIVVTLICGWWRIVYNQIWTLWLHGLEARTYVWVLKNLTVCLLVALRGCWIKPFLSQLVEVRMLSQVYSVQYLGVLMDSTLSWNLHNCNMISRVRSRFVSIIRFGSLPPAVLCVLYSAFVMPFFLTNATSFGPHLWQSRLVWLREFIQSLYVSCHHLTIPSFLLHRQNVANFIQLFRFLNLYVDYLLIIYITYFSFQEMSFIDHLSRNVNRLSVPRVFTNYVFQEYLPIMVSRFFTSEKLFVEQSKVHCYWGCHFVVISKLLSKSKFLVIIFFVSLVVCFVYLFFFVYLLYFMYASPGLHWKSVLLSGLPD